MTLGALPRAIVAFLATGTVMAAEPASVAAQGGTSLGIWGGVYTPLGKDLDLGGVSGSVKRNNSFAVGGRLSIWGPGVLGFELVAGYTPANVEIAGGTINGSRTLSVFAGGAKLMLGLSPALSPVGVHVGAGPAIIRRGHDVTSESESRTRFGALVGGGVRVPFSAHTALRLEAEDYVYKPDFGNNSDSVNDLILSAGVSFGF